MRAFFKHRALFAAVLLAVVSGSASFAAKASAAGVAGGADLAQPPPITSFITERLALNKIISGGDKEKIKGYLFDTAHPGLERARALYAFFKGLSPPMTEPDKELLTGLLEDSSEQVQLAAIRVAIEMREASLLEKLLGFLEQDADWRLKAEAIKSTRPWMRLSHMIYLEKALQSESQEVLAEAVRSIAKMRIHALAPHVLERISEFLEPEFLPHLRSAALNALKGWGKVDWEMLKALILDETAPESLRAFAIEMSDDIAEAVRVRPAVLMEIVERESSLTLMWRAFHRLKSVAGNEPAFVSGIADFLAATPQLNVATKSMAIFLRKRSMAVSYSSGAWTVKRR